MGIQINGNTDTISAIDGGLTVSGASLGSASASNLNISGIVTASGFSGNVTGNINSTGISTFSGGLLVGTGASISSPATNVLTLGTNNTESVRINSSGLVGIGSDSPAAPLNVVNNNANTPTVWLRNISGGGDSPVLRVQGGANNNNTVGTFEVRDYDGNVDFKVGGTGKIGINNTNPLSTLSVGTRTSDVSDTSLIFTAGGSSSGGEVLAATFCNTAAGASNNATAISFTCRSGDSQTAKIVAKQPSGASSPNTQLDFYVYNNSGSTKVVTFDQNGRVTMPYQPAFDAVYTTPGGSVGTTSANTEIIFNVTNNNVGSYYSTSTGRFTAPVAGTYFFSMFGMSNVNDTVWYEMRKNGNLITYTHNPYVSINAGGAFKAVGYSFVITLAVNDYVSVFTGGTTSGLYGGGNNHNGFCGYLIG